MFFSKQPVSLLNEMVIGATRLQEVRILLSVRDPAPRPDRLVQSGKDVCQRCWCHRVGMWGQTKACYCGQAAYQWCQGPPPDRHFDFNEEAVRKLRFVNCKSKGGPVCENSTKVCSAAFRPRVIRKTRSCTLSTFHFCRCFSVGLSPELCCEVDAFSWQSGMPSSGVTGGRGVTKFPKPSTNFENGFRRDASFAVRRLPVTGCSLFNTDSERYRLV